MKPPFRVIFLALFAVPLARPAAGQVNQGRSFRWYWGGQTGAYLYRTNAQKYYFDPIIGVHWMITRQRGALYIGGEEAFFISDATATVVDPATGFAQTVTFSKVRRIFAGLVTYPLPLPIEPFFGLGLALNTVVDPSAANEASNRANAWVLGGVQINVGKLAVFGQYLVSTNAGSFMLMNEQHLVQGGVRYSLGSSREEVGSAH